MYQHKQTGTVVLGCIGLAAAVMAGVLAVLPPGELAPRLILIGALIAFAAVALCFGSLTVQVSRDELNVAFGPGLVRKSYLIADITEVSAVRNKWWYGWGVRYTPHGWLYNVSGLDAVQISLRNGRKYRVDTDQPQLLAEAIDKAIKGEMTAREDI